MKEYSTKQKGNLLKAELLHNTQELTAINLMRQRRNINNITDPVKRVASLIDWKLQAEKYWETFE